MASLALCGAGAAAGVHLLSARLLGLPVVAVASRTPAVATARAAEAGGRGVGYEELPAGADLVVVATPPAFHAADVARALLGGAGVLVEKPLCTTLADADVLVEATRAGGRIVYGENLVHAPAVAAMLARVAALGPLTNLEARAVSPRPTWGAYDDPAWGGGALFDLGAHPIAVVLLLAGAGKVVAVEAAVDGPPGGVTDDHAEVRLRFDTGLVATVLASWRAGAVPLWDVQAAGATDVLRAELLPEPVLERNGDPVPLPGLDRMARQAPQLDQFGYLAQLRRTVQDLETGRAPYPGVELGRAVLEITCAAYASARNDGAAVGVPFTGPRDRTPWEIWQLG